MSRAASDRFCRKGKERSQFAAGHGKRPKVREARRMKAEWAENLERLGESLQVWPRPAGRES